MRATAQAWLTQLGSLIPVVDESTVWNDVRATPAEFELDLRARMVWISRSMTLWCQLDHDLVQSTAGGSWVARMRAPTTRPGYFVNVEVEESMTAQAWRFDPDRSYHERVIGPSVRLLVQLETDDSASFDWMALMRAFQRHVLDASGEPIDGRPWRRTRPGLPDPGDRQRWSAAIAETGAPPWIGSGFGARLARKHGVCMFGARYLLPPDFTVEQIDEDLSGLQDLVARLAADF